MDVLDPSGRDGPYAGGRQTIQTLIRGTHQCLVAEVFFQPAGTDPIPAGATPASSDRLAQRRDRVLIGSLGAPYQTDGQALSGLVLVGLADGATNSQVAADVTEFRAQPAATLRRPSCEPPRHRDA